ncbi:hypothetical protein Misp01_40670 [Microtetraspora sp. NBRC 13810]|nr:hypothetical protein Misp01_40670 [Microtetraspora sp. NBRC 13810]
MSRLAPAYEQARTHMSKPIPAYEQACTHMSGPTPAYANKLAPAPMLEEPSA